MFEWHFRHPSLLALFFAIVGILLSQYPLKNRAFSFYGRYAIVILLLCSLGLAVRLFYVELQIGVLKHSMASQNIEKSFSEFRSLTNNPYSSHRASTLALPFFVEAAFKSEKNMLAEKILPYYQRLCEREGIRAHWYNLALLYFRLGKEEESRNAIQKAIDLMPSYDPYWEFLHYINIIKAARDSGKPLKYFIPDRKDIESILTPLDQLGVSDG
jgi:tetratricopeptide (TPR) repeat protein